MCIFYVQRSIHPHTKMWYILCTQANTWTHTDVHFLCTQANTCTHTYVHILCTQANICTHTDVHILCLEANTCTNTVVHILCTQTDTCTHPDCAHVGIFADQCDKTDSASCRRTLSMLLKADYRSTQTKQWGLKIPTTLSKDLFQIFLEANIHQTLGAHLTLFWLCDSPWRVKKLWRVVITHSQCGNWILFCALNQFIWHLIGQNATK